MNAPTSVFDRWTHPSYERRVRPLPPVTAGGPPSSPTFLWGSAGISNDITFDKPLILHIRNDLFGDAVTFGTAASGVVQPPIGTLQPGECVSIQLQSMSGVYATCPTESVVACLIRD
jgi:hypothetical protein